MEANKKKMIGLVVAIVVLLLIVVGATYAYFAAQLGTGAQTDVDITAESVDSLSFTTGGSINFSITQENFKQGGNNLSGSTTATANLVAAKDTTATYNYYVYLDINKNDFIYTTEEQTAEIILSITKPDNTKITSIDGLEYLTVNGVSGFDITESTDLIKIAENYEITTTSNIEQTWTVEITFINLESNQSANAGRSIQAELLIQKEKEEGLFADYIKSLYTTDGENGLYLHDSDLENGANDGSLRYAGGNYKIASSYATTYTEVSDYNKTETSLVKFYCSRGSRFEVINSVCPPSYEQYYYLASDSLKVRYDKYNDAIAGALDTGYIVPNINNYVCFGSDSEECPIDNLYRIIGVFGDKVKLVKYDYATKALLGEDGSFANDPYVPNTNTDYYIGYLDKLDMYYWNNTNKENSKNIWKESNLNKINLNTNYLNNIGEKWRDLITVNKFVVGGSHGEESKIDVQPATTVYQNEIINPINNSTYKAKIGLLYGNDYGFAGDPLNWADKMVGDKTIKDLNWLYIGNSELLITRQQWNNGSQNNNIIQFSGTISYHRVYEVDAAVRPTFYLSTGVKYVSGDGTESNPYRIA